MRNSLIRQTYTRDILCHAYSSNHDTLSIKHYTIAMKRHQNSEVQLRLSFRLLQKVPFLMTILILSFISTDLALPL